MSPPSGSGFLGKLDPPGARLPLPQRPASLPDPTTGHDANATSCPEHGDAAPLWRSLIGSGCHITACYHLPHHHHVCYYASHPPPMMTMMMCHPGIQPQTRADEAHSSTCPCAHPYLHAYPSYPYPYPHPHPHYGYVPSAHDAHVVDPNASPCQAHGVDSNAHTCQAHAAGPDHAHAAHPHHAHHVFDPHPYPDPNTPCQHCSSSGPFSFSPGGHNPNPNSKLTCPECSKVSLFPWNHLHRREMSSPEVVASSSLLSGPDAQQGSDSEMLISRADLQESLSKSHKPPASHRVRLYDLLHGNKVGDPLDSSKPQFKSSSSDKLQSHSSRTGKAELGSSSASKLQSDSWRRGELQVNSSDGVELLSGVTGGNKPQSDSANGMKPQFDSASGVMPQSIPVVGVKPRSDPVNGVKPQHDSMESHKLNSGLKLQHDPMIDGVVVRPSDASLDGIELLNASNGAELSSSMAVDAQQHQQDLIISAMNHEYGPNGPGFVENDEDVLPPSKLIAIQDWVNAIAVQGFDTYPHEQEPQEGQEEREGEVEEIVPNIACQSCITPDRNLRLDDNEDSRGLQGMFSCHSTPGRASHVPKGYYHNYHGKNRVFSSDTMRLKEPSSSRSRWGASTEPKDHVQRSLSGFLQRLRLKDPNPVDNGFFFSNMKRRVLVNGHVLSKSSIKKAEEKAGKLRPGSYWYDCKAGFWGVMGGPCLGILPPFIEELCYPMLEQCSGGTTQVYVNGRELHAKDLEILTRRGLPERAGGAFMLSFDGILIDEMTGEELKRLGKLAPTVERRGKGFGMFSASDRKTNKTT